MGINSHMLPGDIVATTDRTWLRSDPENWLLMASYNPKDVLVDANVSCLVIGIAPVGSNLGGHIFFVMSNCGKVGWVANHDVIPIATLRDR